MSYQAVIRDGSNNLVTSHIVGMRISILKGSATGTLVYTETQTPSTNANGLVSIEIGGQTSFDTINWASGVFFIKTETDPTGAMSYTITGTSQMLSVPFALHANSAGNNLPGPKGEQGIQGIQGLKGDKGDKGDPGVSGADGSETKLTAGTNISITGTGTEVSPYIINASGGVTTGHYIGELYGGGIVFWVSPDAQHGLVMSLTELSSSSSWSNVTATAVGTASDMFNGLANTNAIAAQASHTTSAAKLCLEYISDGLDDWYLPASWQMSQIYHNVYTLDFVLANDGNAASIPLITDQSSVPTNYWTSTENSSGYAWSHGFQNGYSQNSSKNYTYRVRAVRAF
jgi:hypothetical protein